VLTTRDVQKYYCPATERNAELSNLNILLKPDFINRLSTGFNRFSDNFQQNLDLILQSHCPKLKSNSDPGIRLSEN